MLEENVQCPLIQKCYFRTSVEDPYSKVLIQITDRCNMNCRHCFVKATSSGNDIDLECFEQKILPNLLNWKTKKVTLTGGEPLLNRDIYKFCKILVQHNIEVGLCTNGLLLDDELMNKLNALKQVHINISMDAFSEVGYSKFRGVTEYQHKIMKTIEKASKQGLLKGLLCTPNKYSTMDDYIKLANYAKSIGAKYLLYNPIAPLGRGASNYIKCGVDDSFLIYIYEKTKELIDNRFNITYVRFPSSSEDYVGSCMYNKLFYIYVNGDVVKCPYVSFASNMDSEVNNHIIGNVFVNMVSDQRLGNDYLNNGDCLAHRKSEVTIDEIC